MKHLEKQIIRQNQIITMQLSAGVFLSAILLFVALLALRSKIEADWFALLSNLIFSLIGAAIATIVFSWATKREAVDTTLSILNSALANTFAPMRSYISETARRNDRYDCQLTKPKFMFDEGYDEYVYQVISRSWVVSELPVDFRCIFAVENRDKILVDYFDDDRYVVNYKIESRDCELDVRDDRVCNVHGIWINGQALELQSKKFLTVNGADAKEYIFALPSQPLIEPLTITFAFHVLKWVSYDSRVYLPSQVFQLTEDIEYRLFVDPSLEFRDIIVDTTEISELFPAKGAIVTNVFKVPESGVMGALIMIRGPVQEGSAIRFELHRDPPKASSEFRRPHAKKR